MATQLIPTLSVKPFEKSTAIVTATFVDEASNPLTPNTLTWTLKDLEGNVINSRSAVSISPATTINIVLSGDDLAVTDGNEERIVLIEGTYNSSYGSGLPLVAACRFSILNIKQKTN